MEKIKPYWSKLVILGPNGHDTFKVEGGVRIQGADSLKGFRVWAITVNGENVANTDPDGEPIKWPIKRNGWVNFYFFRPTGNYEINIWLKKGENKFGPFACPHRLNLDIPQADSFEFTTPRAVEGQENVYFFDIIGKNRRQEHAAKLVIKGPDSIRLVDVINNKQLGQGKEFPFDIPASGSSLLAFTPPGKCEKTLKLDGMPVQKPITFKPEQKKAEKPLAKKLSLLSEVIKIGERRWEFTLKTEDDKGNMQYDGEVSFNLPYQAKVFDAHASSTPLPDPKAVEIPDGSRILQIQLPKRMKLEEGSVVNIPVSLGKTDSLILKLEIPEAEPEDEEAKKELILDVQAGQKIAGIVNSSTNGLFPATISITDKDTYEEATIKIRFESLDLTKPFTYKSLEGNASTPKLEHELVVTGRERILLDTVPGEHKIRFSIPCQKDQQITLTFLKSKLQRSRK